MLDVAEARLPAIDETTRGSGAIYLAVRQWVTQAFPGDATDILIADIIGITRGMTDMAGRTRETDMAALTARIRRAVLGYLLAASTPREG